MTSRLQRGNPGALAVTGASGVPDHSNPLHRKNNLTLTFPQLVAAVAISRKFGLSPAHARAVAELAFARRDP